MKEVLFWVAAAKSWPIGEIIVLDEVRYTEKNYPQIETISWPMGEIGRNEKEDRLTQEIERRKGLT